MKNTIEVQASAPLRAFTLTESQEKTLKKVLLDICIGILEDKGPKPDEIEESFQDMCAILKQLMHRLEHAKLAAFEPVGEGA